jgi:hypothetical protein
MATNADPGWTWRESFQPADPGIAALGEHFSAVQEFEKVIDLDSSAGATKQVSSEVSS